MKLRTYFFAVCLALVHWLAGTGLPAQASESQEPSGGLVQLSHTLEDLSERVGPAVVKIFATGYTPVQGCVTGRERLLETQCSSGSGVILDPDGYIMTDAHVVFNTTRVEIELAVPRGAAARGRSILRPRGRLVGA